MADALDALWGDVLKTEQLHGAIRTKATELEIDPALALSLAHQESGFNPSATSPTGVQGLFQVTKATGKQYGQPPGQRTNPDVSIHAGLSYFKDLLTEANGNVEQALTRYNGGSDPRFAANVLSHYPLHAGAQGTQEDPIDALAREIGLTKPTAAPADPGMPMETQVIPNADPTQPALLAPPGAAVGQGTGGYQMTMDIAKPSTGNPPDERRRIPEDLDAGITKALEPTAFDPRRAAAMGINVGSSAFGAIGGAGLGTMTSPVTGPVGPVAGAIGGEMAGSFLGHKINQGLGLEAGDAKTFDPTLFPPSGDVQSLVIPGAVRVGGIVGPQIAKRLPGAPAVLHEDAAATLKQLPGRFAPARPAAEAYAEVAAGTNPAISARNITTAAADITREELKLRPSFRNDAILKHTDDLQNLAKQYRGQIPLEELYRHQQRLGLLVKEAERGAWPQAAELKRLYRAGYQDIDAAVGKGIPEAETLREATKAARREFAQDDLAKLVEPGAPGIRTRADDMVIIDGGKLLDKFNRKLTTDKVFANTFTQEERVEIQNLFHEMAKLPRIPPIGGTVGSTIMTGGRAGLAYWAAHAVTGDAAVASGVAAAAAKAPSIVSAAVMSRPGRALLRQYMHAGQIIGPGELAALRSALGEEGAGTTAPVPTPVVPPSAPVPGLLGPGRVPMPGLGR